MSDLKDIYHTCRGYHGQCEMKEDVRLFEITNTEKCHIHCNNCRGLIDVPNQESICSDHLRCHDVYIDGDVYYYKKEGVRYIAKHILTSALKKIYMCEDCYSTKIVSEYHKEFQKHMQLLYDHLIDTEKREHEINCVNKKIRDIQVKFDALLAYLSCKDEDPSLLEIGSHIAI